MADPVGVVLGGASLAIQLLDGAVKGYRFFIAAAGMPQTCLALRTKLQIEYHRLLSWAEVAGLLEQRDGGQQQQQQRQGQRQVSALHEALQADRLLLVAILAQIKALFDDFAALNGRYKELRSGGTKVEREEAEGVSLVEEFSSVELEYEKKAAVAKKRYLRGTNHVLAMVKDAKEVVMHPKRLVWAAFDEDVFRGMLARLSEYNDFLGELLKDAQARRLEESTRNIFVEMVQVRSSVDELKRLVTASMILGQHKAETGNQKMLQGLAQLKTEAIVVEQDGVPPPKYEDVVGPVRKSYSSIYYDGRQGGDEEGEESEDVRSRARTNGKYFPGDGQQTHVWFEWKRYVTHKGPKGHQVALRENVQRVTELVTLLQMSKPGELRVPRCLGYFDDRDDAVDSEHDARFGLIFEKPASAPPESAPVQLLEAISTVECPSVRERVAIAQKIATSLLYLHAVGWLHRALRSDGIIFFREASPFGNAACIRYDEPALTGFEYARPERDGVATAINTTMRTQGDVSSFYDLYRHPDYQGDDMRGRFRKTFDIYALGIVLLEIAAWDPIWEIVGMEDYEGARADDLKAVRDKALDRGLMRKVEQVMGSKYRAAVEACLKGGVALGLELGEDEMESKAGSVKLQRGFMEKVLGQDGLGGILI